MRNMRISVEPPNRCPDQRKGDTFGQNTFSDIIFFWPQDQESTRRCDVNFQKNSDQKTKQSSVLTPSYDLGKHKPEVEEWKRLPSNTNIFDYSAIARGVREMVALRDMITGKPELSRPAAGNRSNPWPKHLSAEPPTLTDGCVCVTIHIFFRFLAQGIWFSFEPGKALS